MALAFGVPVTGLPRASSNTSEPSFATQNGQAAHAFTGFRPSGCEAARDASPRGGARGPRIGSRSSGSLPSNKTER